LPEFAALKLTRLEKVRAEVQEAIKAPRPAHSLQCRPVDVRSLRFKTAAFTKLQALRRRPCVGDVVTDRAQPPPT
jgi:hypothetical protein